MTGLVLVAGFLPDPANAAGFAVREQSASGLGKAFAGMAASGEDISSAFFNPATLGLFRGNDILMGASVISPTGTFEGGHANVNAAVGGATINGGPDREIGPTAVVPVFNATWALNRDIQLGVNLNSPWGLTTKHEEGWIGRYHALESTLTTINLNPVAAYRVSDRLFVGAGIQAQYAKAKLTNAVDFGTVGAAAGVGGAAPGQQDGFAKLTGDDFGFGWTLGALLEPVDGTRFGIGYRSRIKHDLDGDARF